MRGIKIFGASLLALAVAACNSPEPGEPEEQPEPPTDINPEEEAPAPANDPEDDANQFVDDVPFWQSERLSTMKGTKLGIERTVNANDAASDGPPVGGPLLFQAQSAVRLHKDARRSP